MMSLSDTVAAFPWFFAAAVFIFGACIGSFLNVCIYRIPAGQSIVRPGSTCACGQPIAWYDNIPILSWILLRGHARCCGRPFSIRYPAIELLTAALFLACWLIFPPAKAACGWVLLSALICGTFIDLDHMIIPDVFTIGLGVTGVVLSILVPSLHGQSGDFLLFDGLRSVTRSVEGLLVGSGLVLWIALLGEILFRKEAMGFGDVKLVGAIGAFTGWQGAVTAMFGGAMVGIVWILIAWIWERAAGRGGSPVLKTETAEGEPARVGFGVHVPFGPMLAIAGALHFLWLHQWVADYFGQFSLFY